MHTVFDGALRRIGPDRWQWADGSEWADESGRPLIRDERLNGYNFAVRAGHVCVPRRSVKANDDLGWVPAASVPLNIGGVDHGRRHYYVPLGAWDARNASDEGVVGCTWPAEAEPYIFDKAQDLGWVWPGRTAQGMDMSRGTTPCATPAEFIAR